MTVRIPKDTDIEKIELALLEAQYIARGNLLEYQVSSERLSEEEEKKMEILAECLENISKALSILNQ